MYEMTFMKYFKKLMGWCPTKNSLQKERQEDCFSDFKLENGNLQLMPSSAGLQENRTLKARVNLVDHRWILRALLIGFLALIASLLLWTYIPEGSLLIIFSGLVMFLIPLVFILNHPSKAVGTSEKIIIKRPMSKPVVIEREDIKQISSIKNENHSYRWLSRLLSIACISLYFVETIMMDLKNMERSAPEYPEFSIFLAQFAPVALFLVIYYHFELIAPYKWTLKITTRSNLNLEFYIDEPEGIMGIFKNENE